MEKMPIEKKKILTPKFRVSFPALATPKAFEEGKEPKFEITMLFPKIPGETKFSDKEFRRAAFNAAIEKYGVKEKFPKNLRWPWSEPYNDGDTKTDLMGYAGHWALKAKSKQRPGVIGPDKSPIAVEDLAVQVYAGCYARAALIAFEYSGPKMTPGIGLTLCSVWKIGDGKPFSGRKSAEEDFAAFDAVEDSSEDESNYDTEDSDDAGF